MSSAMISSLLSILCSGVIALLIAFPLGKLLNKKSWIFYIVAAVVTLAYVYIKLSLIRIPSSLNFLALMFQEGYLGSWFLFIVMFIGCLDESHPLRVKLQPNRGELSILSFIFYMAHIICYLASYLPRFSSLLANRPNIAASITLAIILSIIFIALGITSFKAIRTRMPRKQWKQLQSLAYVMMGILLIHILAVHGPSALASGFGSRSTFAVIFYTVLIVAYAVLRIRKAQRDKANPAVAEAAEAALVEEK